MLELDDRTALLIAALLYIVLPVNAWTALAGQRSQEVRLWCGGGLLAGIGILLLCLRGSLPELIAYQLSNLLLVLSFLLRIQSLRLDLGRPWRSHTLLWAVLAHALSYSVFEALGGPVWALSLHRAWLFLLCSLLARAAWVLARREASGNALGIACVSGLMALSLLYAWVVTLSGTAISVPLQRNSELMQAAISAMLSCIVGHFCYLGLVLERVLKARIERVSQGARAEEIRRQSQQLAQRDRQRSLGVLSESLAQELKEPLDAILNHSQAASADLRRGPLEPARIGGWLEAIIDETRRASRIIERIRSFIRPSPLRIVTVDMHRQVCEARELLYQDALRNKVSIVLPHSPPPMLVSADPLQMTQVLLHLMRNALTAMQAVQRRELRVSYTRGEGRILITLRDSGPGLTAEQLAAVGDTILMTPATRSGMGLSISRTILAQFNGSLKLRNAEGGGAEVELELPALQVPWPDESSAVQDAQAAAGSWSIQQP